MAYPAENNLNSYKDKLTEQKEYDAFKQIDKIAGLKASTYRTATSIYRVVSRRKAAEEGTARLARVLSTLDLTALGIGSTLGVGVYVLAGGVAKDKAGPAVVISFLLAAIASILAGLCYAEFGARVPKAGSAYVYSYVCVGEFIAFIIGWDLILEYLLGAASVAKALSGYLDELSGSWLSGHLKEAIPLHNSYLAEFPDLLALVLVLLFAVALSMGMKESTKLNMFCTCVNLSVVLFVIITGSTQVNTKNWRLQQSEVPANAGTGGFAPYGIAGIMRGAAACFYGFIGFDCVATAGEEARRPQQSIPCAVVGSLLVVFLAYFGVSTVLTLMLPYYMQDESTPLPFVYNYLQWTWPKYAITVGAVCALCSSMMGAVFPLPRIIYAMANDGLLFAPLGRVHHRTQTPVVATMLAAVITGCLAMFIELGELIDMMSIGTLQAYSMVASCVMLLRYEASPSTQRSYSSEPLTLRSVARQLINLDGHRLPTRLSSALVTTLVTLYGVLCCVGAYFVLQREVRGWVPVISGAILLMSILFMISRQPVSDKKLAFSVPLVPWLPGLSIAVNMSFMFYLSYRTWVQFSYWILAGVFIYATYSVRHSAERRRSEHAALEMTCSQSALLDGRLAHSLG